MSRDSLTHLMVTLFHLPSEIRQMIWSFLLPSEGAFASSRRNQPEILPTSDSVTFSRNDRSTESITVVPDLLVLSRMTFGEVAHTFYSANRFCFDIRGAHAIQGQMGTAKSYIHHIRLEDRLAYDLTAVDIRKFISEFRSLKSISILAYPEPFAMSAFDLNLAQRAMSLSVVRDLVEILEEGDYTMLFLNYNQPLSLAEQGLNHMITLKLLRHVGSARCYSDNQLTHLWLDMFIAWIYSYPSKRSKLLKVLERMDLAYERSFLTCLVGSERQEDEMQGFSIVLRMPQRGLYVPRGK